MKEELLEARKKFVRELTKLGIHPKAAAFEALRRIDSVKARRIEMSPQEVFYMAKYSHNRIKKDELIPKHYLLEPHVEENHKVLNYILTEAKKELSQNPELPEDLIKAALCEVRDDIIHDTRIRPEMRGICFKPSYVVEKAVKKIKRRSKEMKEILKD